MRWGGPGRRRWLWWGLPVAVLAGGAVVLAVTVLPADSRERAAGPCDTPRTGPAHPVAAPASGLQVVDKGFTVLPGPKTASLGAVVRNTSSLVAYRTRVRIQVFDRQHRSAVPERSGELLDQIIPVILPGQRIGVGAWTYLRETPSAQAVRVAGFDLNLSVEQWWPQHNQVYVFQPITTRHLGTTRDSVAPETGTVRYVATARFCRPMTARGTVTVFRDSAGRLVGGAFEGTSPRARCGTGQDTTTTNVFNSLPPNIDDARTRTFQYCDPAPPAADPFVPGGPFNY